jgi:ElaB/YqjD/DUF883 family membrane-anchored ribosome-binding protein
MIEHLSANQLRRAAKIKDKIDALQSELDKILGSSAPAAKGPVPRKRRRMSAAAKAKISAAQKARWAKEKARKK